MKRLVTGVSLAVAVLVGVRVGPIWLLWAIFGVIALLATRELSQLLERLGKKPWPIPSYLGTLGVAAAFTEPDPPLAPVMTGILIFIFLRTLFSRSAPRVGTDRLVGTLLPVVYIGLTVGHLVGMLSLPGENMRELGEDLIVLALVVVYFGDTAAYYGGKTFGRHKLAPSISPAKTWEGATFNLLGSIGGAFLGHLWFFQALPWPHAIALGALLGTTGIVGDLTESLLKRAATIKDSGGLLPGHGGVLDRVDSLLLAAPVLYWYHRLVLASL